MRDLWKMCAVTLPLFFSASAYAENAKDVAQGAADLTHSAGIGIGSQNVPTGPRTSESVPTVTFSANFGNDGFQLGELPPTLIRGGGGGGGGTRLDGLEKLQELK